jgi:hypothetical protein
LGEIREVEMSLNTETRETGKTSRTAIMAVGLLVAVIIMAATYLTAHHQPSAASVGATQAAQAEGPPILTTLVPVASLQAAADASANAVQLTNQANAQSVAAQAAVESASAVQAANAIQAASSAAQLSAAADAAREAANSADAARIAANRASNAAVIAQEN